MANETGSSKIKLEKSYTVPTEINLIGKTTDEAIFLLDKYIDDAYIAHLPEIRIIHGRGTGGQRIFGNTDGKGEIIGAMNVKDNDEVVCMTSQGKTLRFKPTEIKEQGQGASGVTIVKVTEPDFLVGIDKIEDKDE